MVSPAGGCYLARYWVRLATKVHKAAKVEVQPTDSTYVRERDASGDHNLQNLSRIKTFATYTTHHTRTVDCLGVYGVCTTPDCVLLGVLVPQWYCVDRHTPFGSDSKTNNINNAHIQR